MARTGHATAGQAAAAQRGQGRGAAAPAPARGAAAPGAGAPAPRAVAGRRAGHRLRDRHKGTFEIETYPAEAPKTVAHILALVSATSTTASASTASSRASSSSSATRRRRDMTKHDRWGTGGSGKPIGVAEINPKRTHRLGAVAMAHAGDPRHGRQPDVHHARAARRGSTATTPCSARSSPAWTSSRKLEVGDVDQESNREGRSAGDEVRPAASPTGSESSESISSG